MSKSRLLVSALTLASLSLAAPVASVASAPGTCIGGKPAVIVHVAGFKQASGQVKVSLYGADASRWLAKKGRIAKIRVPVTARAMDICMVVPAPGRYAVAVHHDLNANGDRDRQDGGGYSGNPKVSLFQPKPTFDKAAFRVGGGPVRVGVTLLYIRGLRVGPVQS